jgi:hypothetical protein
LLLLLFYASFWSRYYSSDLGTGAQHPEDRSGAIVFLAPQRTEGSMWGIDRFCLLLRAVRSVDQHINSRYGPYPIYILVAKDPALDPRKKDAAYTAQDRALLRRWAPHSTILFEEINLYSQDALEPNTTREQILRWRRGLEGAAAGRDLGYTSMCRLWSGRLQQLPFLRDFTFYLRMDDDSLLTADFPFDPFRRMDEQNLTYAYRRVASDHWGIENLWKISKPHIDLTRTDLPFLNRGAHTGAGGDHSYSYSGAQPYNNFHVARVSFWTSPQWQRLWDEFNANHLFYKYRLGDANVHAIAVMMMDKGTYDAWSDIPYVHNSNDYGPGWGTKAWGEECQREYEKWLQREIYVVGSR